MMIFKQEIGVLKLTETEKLFYQHKNIEYISNVLGKELWIQVSGRSTLNSAKTSFWAAMVDLDKVDRIYNNYSWDCHIGTETPYFEESFDKITYKKGYNEQEDLCQQIVNFREFYGIKPDYVEFSEEFRFLNNLYHDVEKNIYYYIHDNGDCEEVAKIDNETCAYIKLKYLMKYASAKQMAVVLYFQSMIKLPGTLEENDFKKINNNYKDRNLFYGIWNGDFMCEQKCFCTLMGKKVLFPKPVEDCGYWPYNKRKYLEYAIGIDKYGEYKYFTSDPDKLANYFGDNPDAPHYLTPVFFEKQVLDKYLSHPEIYEVADGILECKYAWSLSIDNHHENCVAVYLGDLGCKLPEKEQQHWKEYNIVSSEELSEVSFKRDFLNIYAESQISDLKFKEHFKTFNLKWKEKFLWNLFLPLSENDKYLFVSLHLPVNCNQQEFDNLVLALVKIVIDSLNEKELEKKFKDKKLKGGIAKLEQWLKENHVIDYEKHIDFLRKLQKLRSTCVGHRKGGEYDKMKEYFKIKNDNYIEIFNDILLRVDDLLNFLSSEFL